MNFPENTLIKVMEIECQKVPGAISLAQGIPDLPMPKKIKTKLTFLLRHQPVNLYTIPQGLELLRQKLSLYLAKAGMNYSPGEIIITCGVTEGLAASLLTILEPGDEVLIPSPSYASYPEIVKLARGEPIFFSLSPDWQLDSEEVRRKINKRTKAVLFCNPNNPTGTVFQKKELLEIARLAEKHNFYIICDEVYRDIIFTKQEEFFSLAEMGELRKRVIRLMSFSKIFALTGWRMGFLHSDLKIIKEILKVHDNLVNCAPTISQYFLQVLLEQNLKEYFLAIYQKRRRVIKRLVQPLQEIFSFTLPPATYFLFPKIPQPDSLAFSQELLWKAKVACVPGIAFGPYGEGHIRLSYALPTHKLKQAFFRLYDFFLKRKVDEGIKEEMAAELQALEFCPRLVDSFLES